MFDCDKTPLKIDKPIRLIELFAGVGAQSKALSRLGVNFEHYKISEWEVNATASYKAIHKESDNTDYSAEFTAEQLNDVLFNIGISTDGKKPMTLKEIARKGEQWKRTVYNNFMATNNIGSILNVKGADLGIVDTDKYCYVTTYSFPCQDLSLAGKGKGMAKDSGTRSGLLWEVERLLNECEELPQILLMENVTQVHGKNNKEHFDEWLKFLESKGYSNYWKDLNSKNFGIPQNRNRTFMVSVLGNYTYEFPKEFPLELRLKDMLEDSVDEKFCLSDAMINYFTENTIKQREKGNGFKFQPTDGNCVGKAVTTRAGGRMDDNFIEEQPVLIGGMQKNQSVKTDGISTTLTSAMGCGGGYVPMVTEKKDNYVAEPLAYDEQNGYIRKDGTVGTLTTDGSSPKHNNRVVENLSGLRIRKLTPKECFRLMGFDDTDFEKAAEVNSNSQLYKQAGNSIVVDVLCYIFREML